MEMIKTENKGLDAQRLAQLENTAKRMGCSVEDVTLNYLQSVRSFLKGHTYFTSDILPKIQTKRIGHDLYFFTEDEQTACIISGILNAREDFKFNTMSKCNEIRKTEGLKNKAKSKYFFYTMTGADFKGKGLRNKNYKPSHTHREIEVIYRA